MSKNKPIPSQFDTLYNTINQIIEEARNTVYRTANFTMVQAYWSIGKTIVEEEQNGKERAEYGQELIKQLSKKLTKKHGKGFTETNLKYMRQFYQIFEKSHALRELAMRWVLACITTTTITNPLLQLTLPITPCRFLPWQEAMYLATPLNCLMATYAQW